MPEMPHIRMRCTHRCTTEIPPIHVTASAVRTPSYTQPVAEQETYTLCPSCGRKVDPNEPEVKYAVEMRRLAVMGGGYEYIDGMGAYIHEHCAIPSGYRPKPVATP
jgi:hypothetical protein